MLFTLKKVIGGMLLPLPLMLLIIGAGLALLWFSRFQKTGKIFISIGWLALLLLSLQPVADRLLRPIESTYPTWKSGLYRGARRWLYLEPAVGTKLEFNQ